MLRVVLDTNVYVSAFSRGGVPLEILLAIIRGNTALFTSPFILREPEGVLLRKFHWSSDQVKRALSTIRQCVSSVSPPELLHLITEDDSGNRILECAKAANAHVIVSGDAHLLKLRVFDTTVIPSPREFAEIYLSYVHARDPLQDQSSLSVICILRRCL